MKIYALPLAILFALLTSAPLYGQAGLTDGERLARLEGQYEYLSTKADIEKLRTEIVSLQSEISAGLNTTRWILGAAIALAGIALAIAQYRSNQTLNESSKKLLEMLSSKS